MKKAPILLGSKRVRKDAPVGAPATDGDEENWEFVYDLLRPEDIVIADDTNEYGLFGDAIFCCPQEDLLEGTIFSPTVGTTHSRAPQSFTRTLARAGSLRS
jgi:hypothetical protein